MINELPKKAASMVRIFSLILIAISVAACRSEQSKLIEICEEKIKRNLRSPSSYRQVAASPTYDAPLRGQQYTNEMWNYDIQPKELDRYWAEHEGSQVKVFYVNIEYDAANSFNAMIRNHARCAFFSLNGKLSDVHEARIGLQESK